MRAEGQAVVAGPALELLAFDQGVVTAAADQEVRSLAPVNEVRAVGARQVVGTIAPGHVLDRLNRVALAGRAVRSRPGQIYVDPEERLLPDPTPRSIGVLARAAVDGVGERRGPVAGGGDVVVAGPGSDPVGTCPADQGVGTGPARQLVAAGAAIERVQ